MIKSHKIIGSSQIVSRPKTRETISAKGSTPKATDEQIQQAMSGVLCRCFTHVRMLRAIKRYAKEMPR